MDRRIPGGLRSGFACVVIYFFYGIAAVAAVYQLTALAASIARLPTRPASPQAATLPEAAALPGISILKPVRGLDPGFAEAIASHAEQDYPTFEILFGLRDLSDPAAAAIERLKTKFPQCRIRLIHATTCAPNGKAGVLMDLARQARYPVWLVNDGDIRVPERYLRRVVAPLSAARNGLITCLYRVQGQTWPARWEGLGIATDFAPSVLVAPLVGVSEFGLGATLVFRAADLARAGGFAAVADYLADDYQIGHKIHGLGLRCVLSDVVVETYLAGASWSETWRHQVRWARTIRVSKGFGYAGLPVTQASLWALIAALIGEWRIAAALVLLRIITGVVAGYGVLRSRDAARLCWLIPLRDLWGVAVWAVGLFGRTVEWGGQRLRLDGDGRIIG